MRRASRAYERLHRSDYVTVLAAMQQCDDANAKEIRDLRREIGDQSHTIRRLTALLATLGATEEAINAALKRIVGP
jgi:DNA-binding transcriptional regulator YhcF (GntR family)